MSHRGEGRDQPGRSLALYRKQKPFFALQRNACRGPDTLGEGESSPPKRAGTSAVHGADDSLIVPQPEHPGDGSRSQRGSGARGAPRTLGDEPDDVVLIARTAARDQEAYMTLYERYSPRVFGIIAAVLGRGEAADDAFQEAMWEVWRCADRYNERLGTPAMWILAIGRNKAVDAVRRSTRTRGLARRVAERTPVASAAPADSVARREAAGACAELLAGLPAEQSALIRFAYLDGRTREDIAAAHDLPVGTVKTRIRAGIQTLARMLEQGSPKHGSTA